MNRKYKHGSYLSTDVEFLLKIIDIEETDINKKEELIQKNKSHYSEMISPEYVPTKEYIKVFNNSLDLYKSKVSENIIQLSNHIKNNFIKKPILVSLARAGTPVGVLLKRTLTNYFYNEEISHYSVSIIRDKEIDINAIKYILNKEKNNYETEEECSKHIIFIDGWTGKGVISKELRKYIDIFNKEYNLSISSDLYVLADISGKAKFAATYEDYLIPSSALNSTVSGLMSRSILNKDFIKENDFHGAKYYKEFIKDDLSLYYINTILEEINRYYIQNKFKDFNFIMDDEIKRKELEIKCDNFIIEYKEKYSISNINYIKPGIGETTRVLLRRIPDKVIIKDKKDIRVKHIIKLCKDKNVNLEYDKNIPYSAIGIIKEV